MGYWAAGNLPEQILPVPLHSQKHYGTPEDDVCLFQSLGNLVSGNVLLCNLASFLSVKWKIILVWGKANEIH